MKTKRLKNLFYYDIEKWKGYIPSDKLHKHNIAFETGFWDKIIGQELTDEWQEIRHEVPMEETKLYVLFAKINVNIAKFLAGKPRENPEERSFYLNFNADGIDCYVSRWNWK